MKRQYIFIFVSVKLETNLKNIVIKYICFVFKKLIKTQICDEVYFKICYVPLLCRVHKLKTDIH